MRRLFKIAGVGGSLPFFFDCFYFFSLRLSLNPIFIFTLNKHVLYELMQRFFLMGHLKEFSNAFGFDRFLIIDTKCSFDFLPADRPPSLVDSTSKNFVKSYFILFYQFMFLFSSSFLTGLLLLEVYRNIFLQFFTHGRHFITLYLFSVFFYLLNSLSSIYLQCN